jgi:hypothetical protein
VVAAHSLYAKVGYLLLWILFSEDKDFSSLASLINIFFPSEFDHLKL